MNDAKDIIFKDDLEIRNGDLFVDYSDGQSIEFILKADRGQFRQWPLIGVGILRQKNGSVRPQELKQEIKLQLRSDNFKVKTLNVISGDQMGIEIDAKRLK